jgi:hypothetical protein
MAPIFSPPKAIAATWGHACNCSASIPINLRVNSLFNAIPSLYKEDGTNDRPCSFQKIHIVLIQYSRPNHGGAGLNLPDTSEYYIAVSRKIEDALYFFLMFKNFLQLFRRSVISEIFLFSSALTLSPAGG